MAELGATIDVRDNVYKGEGVISIVVASITAVGQNMPTVNTAFIATTGGSVFKVVESYREVMQKIADA